MDYKLQLQTENWKNKRKSILQRDNFMCTKCGSNEKLHVHHKIYEKELMAWEAKSKNLITLCEICHKEEHERRHISTFFKKQQKIKPKTKQQKIDDRIKSEMKKLRIQQNNFNQYGMSNFKKYR